MDGRRSELAAPAAIAAAALLFGTSFPLVKAGLDGHIRAVPYLAIRFTLGALVLAAIARARVRRLEPGLVRAGAATGLCYFAGLMLQTVGIQYTTPATSAFLTYLLVVFVPVLAYVVWRRPVSAPQAAATVVAVVGLALLTGGGVGFGKGELLSVLGAVALAAHLLLMGRSVARFDMFAFHAVRAATVAIPCLVAAPFFGGLPADAAGWGISAYGGIVLTVIVIVPWTWAQRRIPAERAAMIFLLEPVFATIASYVDGERLTVTAATGALLILLASATSEHFAAKAAALRATTNALSRLTGEAFVGTLSEWGDKPWLPSQASNGPEASRRPGRR